jgi:hypothetical protein
VNIGQKRRKKRKEMRGGEINYIPHTPLNGAVIIGGEMQLVHHTGGKPDILTRQKDRQTNQEEGDGGGGGKETGESILSS